MSEPTVVRDPNAWRQLAHPTRHQIVRELSRCAIARVADLATLIDEPPNSVSFHLRTLEKHGFVERTASPGQDGRESWWQLTSRSFRSTVEELGGGPEAHRATDEVLTAEEARAHSFVASWFDSERRLDAGEIRPDGPDDVAVGNFEVWLDLTQEDRNELGRELGALFHRWRQRSDQQRDHAATRTTVYQGFILTRPNRRALLAAGQEGTADAGASAADDSAAGDGTSASPEPPTAAEAEA